MFVVFGGVRAVLLVGDVWCVWGLFGIFRALLKYLGYEKVQVANGRPPSRYCGGLLHYKEK